VRGAGPLAEVLIVLRRTAGVLPGLCATEADMLRRRGVLGGSLSESVSRMSRVSRERREPESKFPTSTQREPAADSRRCSMVGYAAKLAPFHAAEELCTSPNRHAHSNSPVKGKGLSCTPRDLVRQCDRDDDAENGAHLAVLASTVSGRHNSELSYRAIHRASCASHAAGIDIVNNLTLRIFEAGRYRPVVLEAPEDPHYGTCSNTQLAADACDDPMPGTLSQPCG
jgi:hypothetical protein